MPISFSSGMGRVANLTGALVGSILVLGLAITAIVFGSILLDGSSQDLLAKLGAEKADLQQQVNAFLPQIPSLIACRAFLWDMVDFLTNCTALAFSECANNSATINLQQEELAALGTSALNTTLYDELNATCALLFTFQDEIAYVANNQTTAVPRILYTGTYRVMVPGTIQPFVFASYEVREVFLASLRLRYLVLEKWTNSVQVNVTVANGVITYDSFNPEIVQDFGDTCDFSRPFLAAQSERFVFSTSGSVVSSYDWVCGEASLLFVHWSGTTVLNELINQNADFLVLGTVI